jgi:membrane protein required for colicin V production
MQKTDIILLIPLLWGTCWGLYKGIISQLTSLVGIVIAVYFSIKYYNPLATLINAHLEDETLKHYIAIAAFLIIFIGLLLLIFFISRQIEKLTKALNISFINHIIGGIFGLIKWAFLLSVILSAIHVFSQELNHTFIDFHDTWIYNHIYMIAPKIMPELLNKLNN